MDSLKNSFENLIPGIGDGLKRRFSDPFINTFTVTFLIWNFQILIYLSSDLSAQSKIQIIRESLEFSSFFIPLLLTPTILILIPYLLLNLRTRYENQAVEIDNIRHSASLSKRTVADRIKYLENRIQEEVDRTLKAQNLVSEKDQAIGKIQQELNTIDRQYIELKKIHEESKSYLSSIEKKNSQLLNENQKLNTKVIDFKERFPDESSGNNRNSVYEFLAKNNLLDEFKGVVSGATFERLYTINVNTNRASIYLAKGLIALNEDSDGAKYITITELGHEVHDLIIDRSNYF